MKRRHFVVGATAATALVSATDRAFAQAGGKLGVILMHGKQSSPGKAAGLRDIASKLESAGMKAVAPSMPWGEGGWERISVTVPQVFDMIDGYAAQLRGQGAQRIVVGGQSLGANMALAYAVARQNVAGVVMAAPGHQPGFSSRNNPAIKEAVDKAAAMVQAGQGAQPFSGGDDNQGVTTRISTTAAVYLSWMSPRGEASMTAQAPLLPASIPLMLIIGTKDPAYGMAEKAIYKPAAKNPYSKYLVVEAGHRDTDFAASQRVVDWIKGLPAN
ncbi:MAG: alpha/beta fold hydrolase [Alphaproteobacteria bacterium]|jgi:esterase/lipase